jgi:methionyl-tRNA synthetase
MVQTHCDSKVPEACKLPVEGTPESDLWNQVQKAVSEMSSQVENMRPDLGVAAVMTAIREANKYIGVRAPWKQAKEEDKTPLYETLYVSLEALRVCAALLYPEKPAKMTDLRTQIGCGEGEPNVRDLKEFGNLVSGTTLSEGEGLFPRHQKPKAPQQAKPSQKSENVVTVEEIEIGDFFKAQLKTAKVLEAVAVEGADKLLKLQLDVAGEQRQIIAGIAKHYTPEQLIGKIIIIVTNLKPAVIRGVESRGMLLAASKGKKLTLVTVDSDDFPSGAKVG